MSTIHSSPIHFIPPATIGTIGQILACSDNIGNTIWESMPAPIIPANAFQIYVSALMGNDLNDGSFTQPLATLNAALTLAGSPTSLAPVVIFLYDASTYDEQIVIGVNVQNIFVVGPTAQINFSGLGDTLTLSLGSKIVFEIANVQNSGTGNAITNNDGQLIGYIDVVQSATTAISNTGSGAVILTAALSIEGSILLVGPGNVIYQTTLRTGTDAPGVVGTNILGTSGPWNVATQLSASGLQYPLIDGVAGNVMTTDGAGTLSLQPIPASFASINQQIFTASGTYTPTPGMSFCIIECVGAGGGGGGVTSSAGHSASAGGGGGGSYSRSLFNAATIGVSQPVTVGAGGFGAAAGANNGGNGTSTSVGVLIEADAGHGGFGSLSSATAITVGIFGAGGGAGTGQVQINGETGLLGTAYGASQLGIGGSGGNSYYGRGGEQLVNLAGANGFNHGSGGSGGSSGNTGNVGGGAGTGGIVIITEYIQA